MDGASHDRSRPLGEGLATETIANPVGTVRLAEPICCVLVSFEKVAVNVWVEPATIGWGAISTAYGFVGVPATAFGTHRPNRQSATAIGIRTRFIEAQHRRQEQDVQRSSVTSGQDLVSPMG